ncbi:NUDIX domain-containing protein [Thalassiella azotivora]
MNQALGGRAAAWLDGAVGPGPAPRPSSTVLLVRDADAPRDGVELFMMRRQPTMAFAAGMHVFPGGGVDPRDADHDVPWAGPEPAEWARLLGASTDEARELVCAAVRETFEESGVLLAGPDGDRVVDDVSDDGWEADRQALLSRDVALSELLARRRLVLRSDLLRPWAHWVTPEFEPRRYDTRFFLAAVPRGQRARHVEGGEATESGWWPARDVLSGHADGRVVLLPPTLVGVEDVAAASSVAELLAARRQVRPVLPWIERADGVGDGTAVGGTAVGGTAADDGTVVARLLADLP